MSLVLHVELSETQIYEDRLSRSPRSLGLGFFHAVGRVLDAVFNVEAHATEISNFGPTLEAGIRAVEANRFVVHCRELDASLVPVAAHEIHRFLRTARERDVREEVLDELVLVL